MRACTSPLAKQLAELALLEDGWLDGTGRRFCGSHIARVQTIVTKLDILQSFPTPFLYPTADQGIRVEWPGDRWEAVLWVREEGALELLATENNGAGAIERYYDEDRAGLSALAAQLAELLKEPS